MSLPLSLEILGLQSPEVTAGVISQPDQAIKVYGLRRGESTPGGGGTIVHQEAVYMDAPRVLSLTAAELLGRMLIELARRRREEPPP
jgi:hypothetical protein